MLKNTLLLTVSSLFIRCAGMIWQVWLAGKIGQGGLGLFQLIMSISALALTVAVSGIRFTTTRLVTEDISCGINPSDTLHHCLCYAAVFGVASLFLLMFIAQPVAFLWLNDVRAEQPLHWVALSLPFLSLSTVIYGYFTAVGRVWKSVCIQLGRELIMMAVTIWLLRYYVSGDIQKACLALTKGAAIADAAAFIFLAVFYCFDRLKHFRHLKSSAVKKAGKRVLSVALPLAVSSYARSGLSTLQHILVPHRLRRSGLTAESALSAYGVIQGMSLPAVLFPSCFLMALAEMTVPKLTETQSKGSSEQIRTVTSQILDRAFLYSIGFCLAFLFLGKEIGLVVYDSEQAGRYIMIFSCIVPVMYMDMAADGCLKGLGEVNFCMYVNIADAGLSALLVWLFLSRGGVVAYLAIICFTELFNFLFSIFRLKKISHFRMNHAHIIAASLLSAACWLGAKMLCKIISAGKATLPALIISGVFGAGLYALICLSALRRQ